MLRTILIVDDNAMNRQLLRQILAPEYDILEACDGREALDTLRKQHEHISAVLLDLIMPVMDGYDVLIEMRASETLSGIPVLVTTVSADEESEFKALTMGAIDFIVKPYNFFLVRQRIQNVINLRENAAMARAAQRDKLTGLYNREAFFEKASAMINMQPAGFYVLSCMDIDGFKVINDRHGSATGDAVLRHIADALKTGADAFGGICCRISADMFAALYPRRYMDAGDADEVRLQAARFSASLPPLSISVGRYIVTDTGLPISAMYDRARVAASTVKHRYDTRVALYDESMRESILRDQMIAESMDEALSSGQFEAWLQPQYNHYTGALIGAEALARWRHPTEGLIAPGVFIPVFERNGFVYELDKFIWEQACAILRKWLDEGCDTVPLSVNLSRYDIFRGDLIDVLTGLLKKYDLPASMLRLEITESAFAESTAQIIRVVEQLVALNFTVEIDDFGSGYSSFNTLKDVPATVLKLDMRFLENSENSQRGGNILESIVRMSKWLGMVLIAEGVETLAQAEYLKSIGCCYVQGFLYARPMPLPEFEALTKRTQHEGKLAGLETVENLDNNSFWDPRSMDTLIFNSYVGGACIFELHDGRMEILRVNDKYAQELIGGDYALEAALSIDISDYMDDAGRAQMESNIQNAVDTGKESVCELALYDLPNHPGTRYLRVAVRVIARAEDRVLLYATVFDVSRRRLAEKQAQELSENLLRLMNDTPGGFVRMRMLANGKIFPVFANGGFCRLIRMTPAEMLAFYRESAIRGVHPDDVKVVEAAIRRMQKTGEAHSNKYRLMTADGDYIWLRFFGRMSKADSGDAYLNIYYTSLSDSEKDDLSEMGISDGAAMQELRELVDGIPAGIGVFRCFSGGKLELVYMNEGYFEMIGASRESYVDFTGFSVIDMIHPDDQAKLMAELADVVSEQKTANLDIRIRYGDGQYHWTNTRFREAQKSRSGASIIYASYADIDRKKAAMLRLEASYHAMELASQNAGISFWHYDIDNRTVIWGDFYGTQRVGDPVSVSNMPDAMLESGGVFPADEDEFRRMYRELAMGAENSECTVRTLNRSTGAYEWHRVVYTRLHDPSYVGRHAIGFSANVNDQQETQLRYNQEIQLRHEIIKDCIFYYQLNLSTDGIEEYRFLLDAMPGVQENQIIDGGVRESILQNIAPEDRAAVQATFFTEGLLAAYQRGETEVSLEYRRKLPGVGLRWVKGNAFIMKRPDPEAIVAFLYFYDIDDEKKNRLALASVVDEEIEGVALIHVETGLSHAIKTSHELAYLPTQESFLHDEQVRRFADEQIEPCDRAAYIRSLLLSALTEALSREKLYQFSFLTSAQRGGRRKNVLAFYLDDTHADIVLARRDITGLYEEEQRQKEALQKAVDAANEASQAKSDFLSRMSHDMRTPMNAIMGMAELAKQEDNPSKTTEYLRGIEDSSQYLMELISSILDLGQIEHGRIVLHEAPYSFAAFRRCVDAIILPMMESKHIDFTASAADDIKCICVDKQRFNQIFIDLLTNAAQFTDEGGRVSFSAARLPARDGKLGLRFTVEDTGCGISEDFLRVLFDPFAPERLRASHSDLRGSGLSLAITKQLVEMMGGSIGVRSKPGEGTTFTVDLYVAPCDAKDAPPPPRTIYMDLHGLSVLLAEDNAVNVLVAKRILEKQGCAVTVAVNGQEALDIFAASAPGTFGVILMDLRMPVMNGFIAARSIRALARADAKTVPIIAVTADAMESTRQKAAEAGMNAHLSKPIDTTALYETMESLL